MDLKAVGMGLGFALVWAAAFTATRVIVVAFPPLTALVIRFAISGAIGMALAWAMGQRVQFTRGEWRRLMVFGICQNALYLGLNWVGMQWVEASAASIIASMMPLIVALMGWLWLGERLRPQAIAGLVVGFVGVAIIMGVRLQHGLDLFGTGLCILAVVALAVATLAVRGSGTGPNVMMAVGVQMLIACTSSCSSIEKSASRTRSLVGRVSAPGGAAIRRPPSSPAMILISLSPATRRCPAGPRRRPRGSLRSCRHTLPCRCRPWQRACSWA